MSPGLSARSIDRWDIDHALLTGDNVMHFGEVKNCDIANGPGVRISLFVSGCRHHCEGCFNPQTWNFEYGKPFTDDVKEYIIKLLAPDFIQGLTLLGGEPFEPENQKVLSSFLYEVKRIYPAKDIWCYTGYLFDKDLVEGGKVYTRYTDDMLSSIDVLVDGEFILAQKDITLKFRGSRNQRIIDIKKSRNGVVYYVP